MDGAFGRAPGASRLRGVGTSRRGRPPAGDASSRRLRGPRSAAFRQDSTTAWAHPFSPPPPPPRASATTASESGGHGLRNTALVAAGLAVAGGGVAVATQSKNDAAASPPPAGSGLPTTGVSGVYVGTESVSYSGSCVGTDDVVLNLQEAGGALSGVLSFTVRTCPCCSSGRGANPVAGSLLGTSVQLGTPIGFSYSGSFAGDRLSGALAGPGGVTGTWSVDKR